MTDLTKETADVLIAVKALAERGIQIGVIDEKRLAFTVMARDLRKEVARELHDKGLSTREIAAVTGSSQRTIARDVSEPNGSHSEPDGSQQKTESRRAYDAQVEKGCTSDDLDALLASGKTFGTIYADPPWQYDNQGTRAATGNHYDGMTVEQICALPVAKLAADASHLHLWTTNGFLFECPKIFEAWGFEFRSSFIWAKPQMGIGNYWRNSHEILLTAIRGKAKRFNDHSIMSWLECSRGAHSAKPEQVRGFIERASPPPFLELFGRRSAPNWTVWGNQIERTMFDAGVAAL